MNTPPTRTLLLINPNTSALTTERLRVALEPGLPAGIRLDIRTATTGASYIACEASHAVAGYAVLEAWSRYLDDTGRAPDGVLIGCFGDPGLFALRECSASPVTGLAEASFILAARHGPFSIVTGGERWKPMLQRLATCLGFADQLRHIETVRPSGAQLQADADLARRELGAAIRSARVPGVHSVILGGAGLAGYAQALREDCPVPLIDSAQAGLTVLLEGLAPAPTASANGFMAEWTAVAEPIARIKATAGR